MHFASYVVRLSWLCLFASACGDDAPITRQPAAAGGSSASGGNGGSSTSGAGGSAVGGNGGSAVTSGGSAGTGNGGTSSGGTIGSGGSSGSVSAGGSGGGGGGAVNAVVVDDFETGAVGGPPNPALFTVRGSGTVQISNEVTRPGGGAQVVKVMGSANSTMFLNTSIFPLPSGVVHFRVYMRFTSANWQNHVGFVEASPGQESQEVRFGGQANAYHANLAADGDGLSPDPFEFPSCAMCVAPVADTWACLRGMFDFPNNHAQLYVNDTLAVDANEPGDWHAGTGMLPQNPTEIGFGWALYGGAANTVYYDDLAIGYEPIPCQ